MECFNQCTVFVVTFLMYAFTDLTNHSKFKTTMGYLSMVFVFLNVLVNFVIVFQGMWPSIKEFFRKICCCMKKAKNAQVHSEQLPNADSEKLNDFEMTKKKVVQERGVII